MLPLKLWHETLSFSPAQVKVKSLSRVRLFVTPWTVAYQAPLSMVFSRQEYWSRLPFPSSGDLPNPGIKPRDQTQVSCIASRRFTVWATREVSPAQSNYKWHFLHWDLFSVLLWWGSGHDILPISQSSFSQIKNSWLGFFRITLLVFKEIWHSYCFWREMY